MSEGDGYGDFGGGGSVLWTVDINDGDVPQTTPKGNPQRNGYVVRSKTRHSTTNKFFEVMIENPETIRFVGTTMYVYLKIKKKQPDDPQVKVKWALDRPPAQAVPVARALRATKRPKRRQAR